MQYQIVDANKEWLITTVTTRAEAVQAVNDFARQTGAEALIYCDGEEVTQEILDCCAHYGWRSSRIKMFRSLYGRQYDRWKDADHRDDRKLYCVIYSQIAEALESLPEEPILYVANAMAHRMKYDMMTMDRIQNVFEGR